jgi:hypothetical protein
VVSRDGDRSERTTASAMLRLQFGEVDDVS